MFNSPVLDVVIGLVFIYLLYSFLATIIQEIIATYFGLRAKTLAKGISRMLDDEEKYNFFQKIIPVFLNLLNSIKNILSRKTEKKKKNKKVSATFYSHPLIKYLGQNKTNSKPAYLTAQNFAKVLIDLLRGDKVKPLDDIKSLIQIALDDGKTNWEGSDINKDTLSYLRSIWADSQGNVQKFQELIEKWFDDTMERASGWYKKKIQLILFCIGLFLATIFNVDTISIVKKLSNDKDARDKLVSMANTYVQNNKTSIDTSKVKDKAELDYFNERLDSLLAIKRQLDTDISKANSILGSGGWPPDTIKVVTNLKTKKPYYDPPIEVKSLPCKYQTGTMVQIIFTFWDKLIYIVRLLSNHFPGFFITALAISLGAPFWFDLLNKFMQLRSSNTEEPGNKNKGVTNTQPITLNLNNQTTSEEAVG